MVLGILIFCLGSRLILWGQPLTFDIEGGAAILMNAQTGAVLFEKNAHLPLYPASTTKVATALYALKQKKEALQTLIVIDAEALKTVTPEAKQKAKYTLPAYWLETDGSHIGLKSEEQLSFYHLLEGMLIPSGNDAANVIAQFVGQTIPRFMEELNAYLKTIGCQQTHFCNPHGLHHPQHQTTAHDLALMTKEALKEPVFRKIVSQTRFTRPKTNKQAATTLLQTNRLLRKGPFYYSKAIGVKTGYHSKAKKTFIGAAHSDDRTLILVLLGYESRNKIFEEAIQLFDAAFNQPKIRQITLQAGPQAFTRILEQADRPLSTYLTEDLSVDYYPAEDPQAKALLYWSSVPLPIQKGQKVGEIHLVAQDQTLLAKVPLLAAEEVSYRWPYSWIVFVRQHLILLGFGLSSSLLVLIVLYRRAQQSIES